ncbi:hypothetical protein M2401_004693 [Pseudomonas sp. JUb42]|uniref:hypothetical protein n=1 Tax=Pseudomonas sp. JUb42 TaxID=2940611 RepID=UPI0021679EBD|nr:hypothetical protein [Pseudomonas sp. JUb42]MCS3470935.1 hypothetical protein [Pseudomonas sp. JUb42]
MRWIAFLFTLLFLSACSGLSPYSSVTPVDQAIKACGLGYSTEAGAVFKGAYQVANTDTDKSQGVDFTAKMQESLNTQVGSILTTKEVAGRMESKDLAAVITGTQTCVVNLTAAYRPNTRSDLVNLCVKDLQKRISGAGSSQSTASIRDWIVEGQSNVGGVDRLKVNARYYEFSGSSQPVSFYCLVRNGSYEDLEIIK